ncbi:hypothetical protein [Candidatus Uabimicrobium amorphum]|uniref:Uncharacterized protein n=1 Tax=Uabimicrobium amorphum TaxID=2596890 RepID=A0A5S9F5J6_UABAM|nr:hypothetical protein [Candidatus Uabimicrobium amorphum]BBM86193.1 hypothetical protein UABAM_04579 [Candidatus Uabimicrobium amorphum]
MIRFLCFVSLLIILGCSNTKNVSPQNNHSETIGQQNKAEIPLILIDNKPLKLNGSSYSFSSTASAEIQYKGKASLFVEKNGQITREEMPEYIALENFHQNTNWYITDDTKPIDKSAIKSTHIATDASLVSPIIWNIFQIESSTSSKKLLAKIQILQTPFSINIMLKDHDKELPLHQVQLKSNSQIKMGVRFYERSHFAIFLCYLGMNDHPVKIEQVYPYKEENKTQENNRDAVLTIPAQDTLTIDDHPGKKVVYCFWDKATLDCSEIRKWLTNNAKGFSTTQFYDVNEKKLVYIGDEKNRVVKGNDINYKNIRIDLDKK